MPTPQNEIPAAEVEKWTGLYRTTNPAALSPGAMYQADNVVVPAPSVLTPRRGYRAGTSAPGGRDRIDALTFFGDFAISIDNLTTTDLSAQNTVFPNLFSNFFTIAALWTTNVHGRPARYTDLDLAPPTLKAFGYDVPPMTPAPRFFRANGNLYLGTNFGTLRVSATPTTLASSLTDISGLTPPPMSIAIPLTPGLFGTYLQPDHQVAYRITWKITDAAGNEHISPPSIRYLLNNDAATNVNYPHPMNARFTNLSLNNVSTFPPDWYEDQFTITMQIWRTKQVPISNIFPDTAGDEMFLVAELPLAGSGYFLSHSDYEDKTPDVPWLQDPLYTNPTTGDVNALGIANANTPPPAAYDIFTFKNITYFANTEEVQRLEVAMIGTGPGGIDNNHTVTLDGFTYIFKSGASSPIDGQKIVVPLFYVGNPYTPQDAPTIEKAIELTSRALVNAILLQMMYNFYGITYGFSGFTGNTDLQALKTHLLPLYASPPTGVPGLIDIQRLVPGATPFTLAPGVGAGAGWAGNLANATSDSNRQPANLMASHFNDPESVPPAFTEVVGRADRPILRGLPLRDSCFVFKGQGDGLWKFTDDGSGTIQISPLDQTVHCIAPETVASLNNAAYTLSDKGVLRITDGGSPENLSNERIQTDLALIVANAGDNISRAFAVAYEAERLYILCLPISATATTCDVQYVYSELTDAWTRWTLPGLVCGGVNPADGKLYWGRDINAHEGNILWVERKDFTDADYQDETFTRGVPGVGTYTSDTLTFSGDLRTSYHVGDLFAYVPSSSPSEAFTLRVTGVVWNVGPNETVVTLSGSADWTAGDPFTQYTGIRTQLQLLPLTDEMPLYEKQWQNVYFYFRRETFDQCTVGYSTEKQPNPLEYPLAGSPELQFLWSEDLGFGLEPWGQHAQDVILKLALDQASARCSDLTLRWGCSDAQSSWQLSAIRIPYDPSTLRAVR